MPRFLYASLCIPNPTGTWLSAKRGDSEDEGFAIDPGVLYSSSDLFPAKCKGLSNGTSEACKVCGQAPESCRDPQLPADPGVCGVAWYLVKRTSP